MICLKTHSRIETQFLCQIQIFLFFSHIASLFQFTINLFLNIWHNARHCGSNDTISALKIILLMDSSRERSSEWK